MTPERLILIIVGVICIIGALAIHNLPQEKRCVRSHVEVNNVPAHYTCRISDPTGCLTYDLVLAQRIETVMCDEYEKEAEKR